MLHIFHANRTERLAARLASGLGAQRALDKLGALGQVTVVVPDEHVAQWLRVELARRMGVAANVAFVELGEFLEQSLRAHDPRVVLLERRALRGLVHDALCDQAWLERVPALAPARRYVGTPEDRGGADGVERRRFQLAAELGRVFEEYSFTRAAALEAWGRGELLLEGTGPAASDEAWQAALWRRVFGEDGLAERLATRRGVRLVLPHEVAGMVRAGEASLPMMAHMFGAGHVGEATYATLEALGEEMILYTYVLNPCGDLWANMKFGRAEEEEELLSSEGVLGGSVDYQGDDSFWRGERAPLPLRLWGWEKAQQLRALEELPVTNSEELFDEVDGGAEAAHLLGALQRDVLTFTRPEGARDWLEGAAADRSIRVLGCPSVQREVETIANEIWELVRRNRWERQEDPSVEELRFHDFAVLVNPAEREVYQTHVRAVFQETRELPYNMVDMPAMAHSRALEAVELLLELPFGQFERRALLRLLTHPNVAGRFPDLDTATWIEWCDELRILHGADRRDHADTYIEGDLFHWDQGLKRLALGAFMTGRMAGERRPFAHGGFQYLPLEYGQGDASSASRLVLMARALIADARFCRGAAMTMADWSRYMCWLVSTYLIVAAPEDELHLQECREALAALADVTLSEREVGYRVAHEAARDALAELEIRRGQSLIDGVFVGALVPRRPLPFKVVFTAGMGEGRFPEKERRRPHDLRQATDLSGKQLLKPAQLHDVSPRERQKGAFLEAFVCARQAFYATYVSVDPRTGEDVAPAAPVAELLYAIEQDYAGAPGEGDGAARATEALLERHELRRFDPRYFPVTYAELEPVDAGEELTPSHQPEAEREAKARALRDDLESHCAGGVSPRIEELRALAAPDVWSHLRPRLGVVEPPEPQDPDARATLRVSTWDVRRFLECPLQGSSRFLLRFEEEGDAGLFEESELFEPSAAARAALLRDVFFEKLRREHEAGRPLDFGDIYDARARWFELRGLLPTGPFYRAARQRYLRALEQWQENLPMLGLGRSPRLEVLRFGSGAEHEHVDVPTDPLVLEVPVAPGAPPARVELIGRTEALVRDASATIVPHLTESVWKLSRKHFMRGFLDMIVLSARGDIDPSKPWSVFVDPVEEAAKFKHKHCVRRFEVVRGDVARGYLHDVLHDMLTRVHSYYLPIEAVFNHVERGDDLEAVIARQRASTWEVTSSDIGPVRDASRFDPPDDAREIIDRRYGLYFDAIIGRGGRK